MNKVKKNRIKYIDILRAIAIILVIIGHIPYTGFNPNIHKWIYSFHIPLFFFISGLTFAFVQYDSISFNKLFKKRFHRIYLPYLIWGITLSLPKISLMTIPKLLYGTHQSIASVSNSSLWFLPVLFISSILLDSILFLATKKRWRKIPFISLLFFLLLFIFIPPQSIIQDFLGGHNLPLGLDIVPIAIVFMMTGYFFQLFFKYFKKIFSPVISIIVIFLLLFTTIKLSLVNNVNYVLIAENRYGNLFNFFTVAFLGIIMSLLISLLIDKYSIHLSNLMQKIGSDTIIIFILHKYPLLLINDAVTLIPVIHIANYLVIPLYLFFSLLICIPISSSIKKYAPILIGKPTN